MAPEKQVKVEVVTDVEASKVEALETKLKQLKSQKLQLDIDARTDELEATEHKIQSLKIFLDNVNTGNTNIHIDDSDIEKAEAELAALESHKLDLEIAVETGKLEQAQAEVEELDDTQIDLEVDANTALLAVDQIGQGFDRLKQGALEIKAAFSDILGAAGAQEMNKTFLEMNLGASGAASALQDINSIVANLPGDDTALQGLLSQAAAQNAGITRQELEGMATAATDYFSAMSFYGKSATEAQQDMTNYILAGNTAELERSPILQGHIDKLKEGTTIQERSKLLQEALNDAGWGGISQQDTYNNKLQTFMGMLDRGKYTLGGFFQEGAKGAMDFILKLDEASNGLVGMGLAALSFAQPVADSLMGIGQAANGLRELRKGAKYIKELETVQKTWKAVQEALIPVQYAEGIAGQISIGWIALAVLLGIALGLAFIYLYENCDWFREAVDNLASTLQWLAGEIFNAVIGAIDSVRNAFSTFTSQLGLNTNDWTQAVLGFILFLPQLPMKVGEALLNTVAKALGFGDNFVATMQQAAMDAVNGFVSWITGLADKFREEVDAILDKAEQLAQELPEKIARSGLGVVGAWFDSTGEHSPGYMYEAFAGELDAMLGLTPGFTARMVMAWMMLGVQLVAATNNALMNVVSTVINIGANIVSQITSIAQRGVSGFSNAINGIVTALQNCLSWAYNVVMSSPLVSALQWLGQQAAWAFSVLGLGQSSPGKIVEHMEQELDWTSEAIQHSKLATDTKNLGASMASSFNPSLIGGSGGSGGSIPAGFFAGDTVINVYGDVDSDKRVQEIVDAVRRELNWDNKTAGRTV